MHAAIKAQIVEWAKQDSKNEVCGFLYHDGTKLYARLCPNVAKRPSDEFAISAEEYLKCESLGEICGVFHSHPSGPAAFSPADLEYIEQVAVPLYLYATETGDWAEYIPPTYEVGLVGLPFIWGWYDCYSLVRNYFRQNHQIFLGDYDRETDHFKLKAHRSLIIDNFAKEGFSIVASKPSEFLQNLQDNDCILFNNPSVCPESSVHLAVFLGNSRFLHHPEGILSKQDFLDASWIKRIRLIVRHKNFVKTGPEGVSLNQQKGQE